MSIFGMKEWVCNALRFTCTTRQMHKFIKIFYRTFCFFHQAICYVNDSVTNNSSVKTNFTEKNITRTNSKLYCSCLRNHFDNLIKQVSSIAVTPKSKPCIISLTIDDRSKMADFFDTWIKEISSTARAQTSPNAQMEEQPCHLNLQKGSSWWTELLKKGSYLANSIHATKMEVDAEIRRRESRLDRGITNWIWQKLENEWLQNINSFQFVILFCIMEGICLFVLYLMYDKFISKNTTGITSMPSVKVNDAKITEKVIKHLEKNKVNQKHVKKEFGRNSCKSSKADKGVNSDVKAWRKNPQVEIDQVGDENLNKSDEELYEKLKYFQNLPEHASKLKEKCKAYRNQLHVLNKQFLNFHKTHDKEIHKYFEVNRDLYRQFKKTEKQLNVSHQVHQSETKNLHEYIAQLQAQYEQKSNEFSKQSQAFQQELRETQDRLQHTGEICNEQRDLIANLSKTWRAETDKYIHDVQKTKQSKSVRQQDSLIVEILKNVEVVYEDSKEKEK